MIAARGAEAGTPEGSDSIFISYAGSDRQWAEWVAWRLEEAGHRVELDVWHWRAGDNFVRRMAGRQTPGADTPAHRPRAHGRN
ncbi:toll/interleukin-1 receptor domain-containing protein [Streptomyces sp. NPDC002187]|uniref:toll/interleukin-1 receptor domain-containing protein n=1 Tax=Streptomyces sp. NPDC002187 TaxID=3364637 RepID=UPI0036855349